jgi:hypothetical protein
MERKKDPEHIEEKKESARVIKIWLDSYDDIFSDFDPRPFAKRALSDDFIAEATKVSKESDATIDELRLFLPENVRDGEKEAIITKRLEEHFKEHYRLGMQSKRKRIAKGFIMFGAGVALMMLASYVGLHKSDKLGLSFLFVIIEPSGWFFVWTSLESLFNASRTKPELEFYTKLLESKTTFVSIE